MSLEDIISKDVESIANERKYWFVRTDSGRNFDIFVNNGFIAIGWNSISYEDIITLTAVELKDKISKDYAISQLTKKGRSKVTAIYHKITKFINISENDIIVAPSTSSTRLAFGIIKDRKIYSGNIGESGCNYIKRRKVEWITVQHLFKLDAIFYKMIKSMHSISTIKKEYENVIDNVTYSLYIKSGFTHFVLDVTKQGDIDFDSLLNLMNAIKTLSNEINMYFNIDDADALSIKLNLQSPGKLELKKYGLTVILIGMIFASCTNNRPLENIAVNNKNLTDFALRHTDTLTKIDDGIKALKIKVDMMNKK